MEVAKLGSSGIEVTRVALGTWAIGGWLWGGTDVEQSVRAIHAALDMGITTVDTAPVYGFGLAEEILAEALARQQVPREKVIIATKFGMEWDDKQNTWRNARPERIRKEIDDSLRRLRTDYIDLYQLHLGSYDLERVDEVLETLERLVDDGMILWYGWSTDDPVRAASFARGPHCTAIQQRFNIFEGNAETLAVCEAEQLASIVRGPLAQGILTGKFTPESSLPENDVRHSWDFREGEQAKRLEALGAIREVLTAQKRTLAQGALGWLWARSEAMIPIPGFKTVEQVEENAAAMLP